MKDYKYKYIRTLESESDLKEFEDSIKGEYKESHTSLFWGYVSRKIQGKLYSYNGLYGRGYVLESPNKRSNSYSFKTYYIKK